MAAPVVRNDEATGSIPVSSTIFPITYSLSITQLCSILFQTSKLAASLPHKLRARMRNRSELARVLANGPTTPLPR